jgi:hypothetical protein
MGNVQIKAKARASLIDLFKPSASGIFFKGCKSARPIKIGIPIIV